MIYKRTEIDKKEKSTVLTKKEKEKMTREYAILLGYEERVEDKEPSSES